MLKQYSLAEFAKETLAVRRGGQNQSDESKERDRKFAERAAQIEKMKRARLEMTPPASLHRQRSKNKKPS